MNPVAWEWGEPRAEVGPTYNHLIVVLLRRLENQLDPAKGTRLYPLA